MLVIALERIAIADAREWRGTASERPIAGVSIATPWLHIEATLAAAQGLPILVIREPSVREDGLLEAGHGWDVHVTPLNANFLESPAFTQSFGRWCDDVRRCADRRRRNASRGMG